MKIKESIYEVLKQADPKLNEESNEFKAAAVLLASTHVGPYYGTIAKVLGYPRELVSTFGERLTTAGIWKGRKVHANWNDPDTGGAAFWCDVCVALGLMTKK